MNQAAEQPPVFDLIIEGVAYLNRIRTVTPRKGPGYMACTLNALMGPGDAVEYLSIDCRIVGKQAGQVVEQLKASVDNRRCVLVGFRAGDPRPERYEFPDRETGQPVQREGLKARLLQITFAKVDGDKVDIPLVQRPSETRTVPGDHDAQGAGTSGGGISGGGTSAMQPLSPAPASANAPLPA